MSQQPAHYPFSFRGDRIAPELAETVAHCPVRKVLTNTGTPAWLVAGYEEVRSVLRDRRFSLGMTSDPASPQQDPLVPPEFATDTLNCFRRAGMLATLHRGIGAGQQHLPEKRIEQLSRDAVRSFLAREQPADLMTGLVLPLTRALTFELLGLPAEGAPDDASLLGTFRIGAGSDTAVFEAGEPGFRYVYEQLPRLREERTGLLGELIAHADEKGATSDEQLAELFFFLLISQYGNPATTLALTALALMRCPGLLRRLREEPGAVPGAVDEVLRWGIFLGDGLPRIAREDVTVGGVRVRRGELVLVSTDGANHDPRVFPEPDRLDIDRPAGAHLRFGDGRHRCPGRGLAVLQAVVGLRTLAEEIEELRPAIPLDTVAWHPDHAITMPRALPAYARGTGPGGGAATRA